jgi:stage III sporulation protein AG
MKDLLKSAKNVKIIILVAFLGICLIFMSSIIPKSRDKPAEDLKTYAENYRIQTQNELAEMLSSTEGVGKCQVLLTLAATEESVETKSTHILMPPINGAYVICEGGDSPIIREQVTYAVASVLNITKNKVYVSKLH